MIHGHAAGCTFVDELYFEEMLSDLHEHPLVPASEMVEQYSRQGVPFPTFMCVQASYEPVRQMTAADIYLAEQALHSTIRRLARRFFWAERQPITLQNEPLSYAIGDLDDPYAPPPSDTPIRNLLNTEWEEVHRKVRDEDAHYRSFADGDVDVQNFIGSLENWCAKSSLAAPHFFAVDSNAPPKLAAACLRTQLEALQAARASVREVNLNLFLKWIDDGVLPFIDLKMSERVEADRRRNPRLAFREEDLANAIYKRNPHRSSTCVSDTTRPVADSLMDANSSLFRTLLNAASNQASRSSAP